MRRRPDPPKAAAMAYVNEQLVAAPTRRAARTGPSGRGVVAVRLDEGTTAPRRRVSDGGGFDPAGRGTALPYAGDMSESDLEQLGALRGVEGAAAVQAEDPGEKWGGGERR